MSNRHLREIRREDWDREYVHEDGRRCVFSRPTSEYFLSGQGLGDDALCDREHGEPVGDNPSDPVEMPSTVNSLEGFNPTHAATQYGTITLGDANPADTKLRQFGWTVTGGGCWEWNGGRFTHRGGYGQVRFEGRVQKAHRLAYVAWVGPIPDGHFVCHSCDNPPCINPDHLFVGTAADNNRDKVTKGRASGGSFPGEAHPLAVLTEAGVREIRRRLALGAGLTELGREYGVTKQTIRNIKIGRTWAHVE